MNAAHRTLDQRERAAENTVGLGISLLRREVFANGIHRFGCDRMLGPDRTGVDIQQLPRIRLGANVITTHVGEMLEPDQCASPSRWSRRVFRLQDA